MSVHYKFKSALEYDTVTFDGLHISVKDLKNAIIQQKRIGKSTDFDLQVTNAQTKEVYGDENVLIPKNTSLLIARIPVSVQKPKHWDGYGGDKTPPLKLDEGGPIAKAVDLSCLDAPEDDKIKAMMSQSTQDYDPSNYMKIRGSNQMGVVPPNYRCYKCHQGGHWIKDCTFGLGSDPIEIKKSTGIPKSFMVPVEGPQVPGAMMTPNGQYAVPLLDHQAYNQKVTPAPAEEPKPEIPEDLICSICSDLLTDAVMIPCCGNSFCDECIRGVLLESEDHECPDCHEKEISPDTLIPNRFIRTSVMKFKNTTGYVKKPIYREPKYVEQPKLSESNTPPLQSKQDVEEKTIISEADSTEQAKLDENIDFAKDVDINEPVKSAEIDSIPEGPPGVSPKNSPKREPPRRHTPPRESRERSSRHRSSRHEDNSPKIISQRRRSPIETRAHEERSGTPTIDEPVSSGSFPGAAFPPAGTVPSVIGPIPTMQVPPQPIPTTYSGPGQPPIGGFPQGPPPNFRLPPPGSGPAPYMAPGPYPIPPRGIFDGNRLPLTGPPPNFNPNFPQSSRNRDFNRRIRDRTPPGLIDDPLAAFNRMLREKDEQKRRAKRFIRRSYSRSRSRSRSYSRSPVRRRSRSPRSYRRSKSRSRSFSLSRSRSRSYSGSRRGSPYRPISPRRVSSPPPGPPARRGPSRYRSPALPSRSPPPRSRHHNDRHRDRDFEEDREYPRDDRYKDNRRDRNPGDVRKDRDRDRDRYYDERTNSGRPQGGPPQSWNPPPRPVPEPYYPPNVPHGYQSNRFPQGHGREYVGPSYNQPFPQTIHAIQPVRQFQDIRPPGVDDDLAPPGVDEPPMKPVEIHKAKKDDNDKSTEKRSNERRDRDRSNDRKRKHEKRSRTPDARKKASPRRRSRSKEIDSPDKHRRKRRDSSDDRDKKRDHSDDEKYRKNKDKKRHRDKKETDKKKKRDRKDKHKKDGKEKKHKEEFKQVIPKKSHEDSDDYEEDGKRKERHDKVSKTSENIDQSISVKENKVTKDEKTAKKEKENIDEPISKEGKQLESPGKVDVSDKRIDTKKLKIRKPKEIKAEKVSLKTEPKPDLYEDMLSEEIDTKLVENYGKIEDTSVTEDIRQTETEELEEEGEIRDFDDEEKDVLELHTNDIDLKAELEKTDILAPVPEKSKWEVDEDMQTSPRDSHISDSKSDKSGKVTNEVLKRAENAIFAKAINAIRPIEIKKISNDRAKLYSGEQDEEVYVAIPSAVDVKKEVQPQPRLSVKDRLGVKVEDTDIINLTGKPRSGTISPFSRRGVTGRNYGLGERRIDMEDSRSRERNKLRREDVIRDSRRIEERYQGRSEYRKDVKREDKKHDDRKIKRKRSGTPVEILDKKDKHKKKEKRQKKEKSKKGKEEYDKSDDKQKEVKLLTTTKRKPTIDEASFEPDYDLESHTDEEDDKDHKNKKVSDEDDKNSSSSESESESSSDNDRKKKKHRKHKKKRRRDSSSSSSSSESESESSDSEKERKRRKHKKNKKKKKKSKHK